MARRFRLASASVPNMLYIDKSNVKKWRRFSRQESRQLQFLSLSTTYSILYGIFWRHDAASMFTTCMPRMQSYHQAQRSRIRGSPFCDESNSVPGKLLGGFGLIFKAFLLQFVNIFVGLHYFKQINSIGINLQPKAKSMDIGMFPPYVQNIIDQDFVILFIIHFPQII